jgi:hypothetical protein
MNQSKILFIGASNTAGFGLEIEFDPKYQDDEWLKENSKGIPFIRQEEDKYYWKKYRFSVLVCKELDYEELNISDLKGSIGQNSITTCWMLQNQERFSELMEDVKYVIFELSGIRWYDEDLHGKNDKYPNTVKEMINILDNPPEFGTPEWDEWGKIQNDTLNWLRELDIDAHDKEITDRFKNLQSLYPDVTFLILKWNAFDSDEDILGNIINPANRFFDDTSIHANLQRKKLCLYQTEKVFNGDYEYAYKDEHPNSEGHRWVASIIIQHIKNLENTKI